MFDRLRLPFKPEKCGKHNLCKLYTGVVTGQTVVLAGFSKRYESQTSTFLTQIQCCATVSLMGKRYNLSEGEGKL